MPKEKKVCSVEECEKPVKARGWCEDHYGRWRRHKNPKGGRTGPGEAAKFYREVVLPHQGEECLIWPFARAGGYGALHVQEGGKRRKRVVSRLVCAEVHGPPSPGDQASHICGRGHEGCVNPRHLRWASPKKNTKDKQRHGTWGKRLTPADVKAIRLFPEGTPLREIALQFGLRISHVGKIRRGEAWDWVEGERQSGYAAGGRNGAAKLTPSDVLKVRRLKGRKTQAEIASLFGVSDSLVSLIQRRKVWPHLADEPEEGEE